MLTDTLRGVILIGVACGAAACASNPARLSVKVPLEIPEPPPRVAMDPVAAVIAEAPPPEIEEPEAPATAAVVPPSTPRVPAATAPSPPAGPPVAQTPEPARTPPPELRPAGAGRTPNATQLHERLVRTKQKLDSIDRRRLNQGQRADYDSARRFLQAANDAVSGNNLLLAESSVEKAETLADGLR